MSTRTEGRFTRPTLKLTPTKTLSRVALRTTKPEPVKAGKPVSSTATVRRKAPATIKKEQGPPPPPPPTPQLTKSSLRSRRDITPTLGFAVPKQKTDVSYNASHEDNEEKSESLEDKIRTALTKPRNTGQDAGAPTSVKSVRWDPAIVSCGPITPPPISNSLSNRVKSESAQSPKEPTSSIPKRIDISKEIIMQTLSRVRRSDRDTLRRLLDELKNGESEDETRGRPGIQHNESQAVSESNPALLNPEAPAFRKYATQRAQIAQRKAYANLGKATLTIPRKRPHLRGGEIPRRDLQEPTWINIFNPPQAMPDSAPSAPGAPSSLGATPSHLQQNLPRPFGIALSDPWAPNAPPAYSQMPTLNAMPQISLPPPIEPPRAIWGPVCPPPGFYSHLPQFGYWINPSGFPVPQPPQLAQPVQTIQPIQAILDPMPTHPAQSVEPTTIRRPRRLMRPRGDRGPMVDIGPDFIPPEDGPGREARAIETGWATSLLAKFREKYPQTGRVKAAAPAPTKMRPAAAIQQRLEFILYQENERRAREGSSGDEKLEEVSFVAKHPRTRGERSSEDKPPSYKRYDTATGIKFEFSGDQRVTSNEEVSTDEIVREQKEAFAHLREKSASVEEINVGEASAGNASPGEDQIEHTQAEDQTQVAVRELSSSFSNLSIGT